jgi:hypothetical protein
VPAVGEPLEPVPAPVDEGEFGPRAGQLPDDLGDQDLAALGPAGDPGRGVHRLPVEVVTLDHDLAGVDSDADLYFVARRGGVALRQADLDGPCASQRLADGGEGDHEPVAERLDLPAVVGGHTAPHDLLMSPQDPVGDRVSPFRAQVGRPLDVTEQDRDRAVGELLAHRPPLSADE